MGVSLPAMQKPRDNSVSVWPCMADAVALFFAMGTQWRVGPAGVTGLDYAALKPCADALEIKMTPATMCDVRELEAEALRAWSAKRG